MAYSEAKVDWKPNEHETARKLDSGLETILGALDDGFEPIEDLVVMAPAGWALTNAVREAAQDFHAIHGRMPRPSEIAFLVGTYFVMLERDNRWIPSGHGATSNPPDPDSPPRRGLDPLG